jgi:hypothetical protein
MIAQHCTSARSSLLARTQPSLLLLAAAALLLPAVSQAQVTFNGEQSTVATGFSSPVGVAVDGAGDLFVADAGTGAVTEVLAVNGSIPPSPSTAIVGSGFRQPTGVAVDGSGDVFVADPGSAAVFEVLAVNGSIPALPTIKTLGNGFNYPIAVALDANGNVFVADEFGPGGALSGAVKEITAASGYANVNTLAGSFQQPVAVAVDASGNVFAADQATGLVTEIASAGGYSTAMPLGISFVQPAGVAVDATENVYVTSATDTVIYELTAASSYSTAEALGSGLSEPGGLAVDANGNIFITDGANGRIEKLSLLGVNFGSHAVGSPSATASLPFTIALGSPTTVGSVAVLTTGVAGLDFADAGGSTCTAKQYNSVTECVVNVSFTPGSPGLRRGAVVIYDGLGNGLVSVPVFGTGNGPQVTYPPGNRGYVEIGYGVNAQCMALDAAGDMFIGGSGPIDGHPTQAWQVAKFPIGGGPIQPLGSGFGDVMAVAVDGSGNVFVGDTSDYAVKEILAEGGYTTVKTLLTGRIDPNGLAVDGSGNVFVSDYLSTGVTEILAAGGYTATRSLGSGLSGPWGVAVDGGGNVFVADYGNFAVKEITAASGYTTVKTLLANQFSPTGVALDASGNVYALGSGAVTEILAVDGYSTSRTLGTGATGLSIVLDASGNAYAFGGGAGYNFVNLAGTPGFTFKTSTQAGSTDTADGPQTATISNIGNEPLIFTTPTTGSNPSYPAGFLANPGDDDLCSSGIPLAAGASCDVSAFFAPVAAGQNSGSVVLTDNNLNQANATQSISVTGNGFAGTKTVPAITWTAPGAIPYGAPLAGAQLNATASVAGTFVYTPPAGTVLPLGPTTLTAVFTPSDTTDYTTALAAVPVTVVRAKPEIVWATPAPIIYGAPLSAAQLQASASIPGTFVYSPPPGTVLPIGTNTLSVTFTPTNSTDYAPATATVQLTVNQAKLVVTWPALAPTVYGTPLGATQLDATSTVPGAFVYTPPAGTVLSAGLHTLSVTFTPTDTSIYPVTTATAQLTVIPAVLTVTANNATRVYGAANPPFTYTIAGFVNGDTASVVTGTPALATTATAASPEGSYLIAGSQGSLSAADYTFAFVNGILTVTQASQTITFPAISTQTKGSALNLQAAASSGLPVSFSSVTPTVCSVSGSWTLLIATGSCTIAASQSGTSNYFSATPVYQTFTVSAGAETSSQTISFAPIPSKVAGTSVNLQATASSGLPVSFQSTTPSVCSVSGTTASLLAYGFCAIQAWQGGSSKYYAAPEVTQQFGVAHATQTIGFPAIGAQIAGTSLTLTATASSGLPVTFNTSSSAVCTISGATVTFVAYGFCAVTASQAGNNAAGNSEYFPVVASQTIGVAHAKQTITFAPIAAQIEGTEVKLTATASSGLSVTFSSTTTKVCTVSDATAFLIASGTCTIQAMQPGNKVYAAAPAVKQSFTVSP